MNEQAFWQIIENIKDSNDKNSALREILATKELVEIAEFDKLFTSQLRHLWHWDNWEFAYIICGCNSEYDFLDFCNWLITQGNKNLTEILADPEILFDYEYMPFKDSLPAPYCDELDLVAGLLYEEKEGQELPYHNVVNFPPQGKKFKNKPKLLKQKYPKLFGRYWQQN